jgi:hypothetical protein
MDTKVQDKWLVKVVRTRKVEQRELNYKDVVEFIEHLSLLASEPSYSQHAYKNDPKLPDMKSFGVGVQIAQCPLCSLEHNLEDCEEFKEMRVIERAGIVWQNRLCYNCLKRLDLIMLPKTA